MRTVITLHMKHGDEVVAAYLADGSLDPIIWNNPRDALTWARANSNLFEDEPNARIHRGRFGIISGEGAELMLGDRVPCAPLDDAYVQEGDALVNVDDETSISLRVAEL